MLLLANEVSNTLFEIIPAFRILTSAARSFKRNKQVGLWKQAQNKRLLWLWLKK